MQLKPPETEVPYEQLLAELNRLVGRIERDETGIDQLIGDVNRAYDIVAALRGRIGRTEELLAEVIAVRQAHDSSGLEAPGPSDSAIQGGGGEGQNVNAPNDATFPADEE